jgi:DNA-binding IclR family transcriptional regulator
VAVPILNANAAPVGALSCALPSDRMTSLYQQRLVHAMRKEADSIAQRLGA